MIEKEKEPNFLISDLRNCSVSENANQLLKVKLLVDAVFQSFYESALDNDRLDKWADILCAYPVEDIKTGFSLFMQKNKGYQPNLAAIVGEIMDERKRRENEEQEKIKFDSVNAWNEVIRLAQTDFYYIPDFQNLIIHNAIDHVGGWLYLCRLDDASLPFVKKQFCDYYIYCAKHPERMKKITRLGNGRIARFNNDSGKWEELPCR